MVRARHGHVDALAETRVDVGQLDAVALGHDVILVAREHDDGALAVLGVYSSHKHVERRPHGREKELRPVARQHHARGAHKRRDEHDGVAGDASGAMQRQRAPHAVPKIHERHAAEPRLEREGKVLRGTEAPRLGGARAFAVVAGVLERQRRQASLFTELAQESAQDGQVLRVAVEVGDGAARRRVRRHYARHICRAVQLIRKVVGVVYNVYRVSQRLFRLGEDVRLDDPASER